MKLTVVCLKHFFATAEPGFGKAALFLSMPRYAEFFEKLLGEKPFAGTLNARVSEKVVEELRSLAENNETGFRLEEKIVGGKKLGGVSCLKARVSKGGEKIAANCLLVFPDKGAHEKSVLEVVAASNLRKRLLLKDGDKMFVEVGWAS